MTAETPISPTDIDPESPITTILTGAWTYNWIAGFEGNSSNKVATAALKQPASGTTYTIYPMVGSVAVQNTGGYPAATNLPRHQWGDGGMGVTVLVPGVITVYLEHYRTAAGVAYHRVLKNGVVVVPEVGTGSGTALPYQYDITVATGDVVVIQHRLGSATVGSWLQNVSIKSSNPDMCVTY